MALLDQIPDSTWFFCFPMSIAVWCIVMLGVCHPFLWVSVWRVYRSELFIFMYVLVGLWSLLSCALIYGIISKSSCIYVFWIWYTLAFAATMGVLMFLLFCGFCVLGMKRKSVGALIGLLYYLVTMYFVVIVNKQRKEVFGLNAYCGGSSGCDDPDIPIETSSPSNALATSAATNTTTRAVMALAFATTTTAPATTTTTTATTTTTTATTPSAKDNAAIAMALMSLASYLSTSTTTELSTHWIPRTRSYAGALYRRDAPGGPANTTSLLPRRNQDPVQSVIAMLSNLLINSDECRTPLAPAHGRYEVGGGAAALRLTLHCDAGYVENSRGAECRRNWWDRPIPQCRKRNPRPPATGCTLPRRPAHGSYAVVEHARARPGHRLAGEVVVLAVTCAPPYRAVDDHVLCVRGRWRHAPPDCQKHCKLDLHPSVDYKCLHAFKDTIVACASLVQGGGLVVPACRPAHAHRGPFRYMRCRAGRWDHVVTCTPNSNFTN